MESYREHRFFIGDFDDNMEQSLLIPLTAEIERQSHKAEGRIDLWINSHGGYLHLVNHLVALVELAKANGVVVRTVVPDIAYSAGSMLAITGTPGERYIGKSAEHLVHYGTIGSFESTEEQIERYTKYKRRRFQGNIMHYNKYCEIPDVASKIKDDGCFIVARDAIKWKMADKYLDKLPL